MAKKKLPKRATRKKLKLLFTTKLTMAQIIFSVVFLIIIFVGLGLFFFSTNTGLQYRMLINSKLQQANGNFYDFTQSLTPTPTRTPALAVGQKAIYTFYIQGGNSNDKTDPEGHPIIHATIDSGVNVVELNPSLAGRTAELPVNTLIYLRFPQGSYNITITPNKDVVESPDRYGIPTSVPIGFIGLLNVVGQGSATIQVQAKQVQTNTPEPSPTLALTLPISEHQPNKLVVTQSGTALSIAVSNPTVVKKIFDDILQLPVMSGQYNCPIALANAPIYTLSFYQDTKLMDTAVLTTTGCRTVTIDNYPARLDNESLSSFDTDFKQATGL